LMMMLQRRLVVVLRSMIWEWSMEAIVDAPSGERHTPSLYAACSLLIILRMIMVKITWPPACTCRCLAHRECDPLRAGDVRETVPADQIQNN
jgi:hypothetical protein